MIILRLSSVVNDVTIEVEGDANSFDDIQASWESFQEAISYCKPPVLPSDTRNKIIEVL